MNDRPRPPEIKGHDVATLDSGRGSLERALEKHLAETDLGRPQHFKMRARLPQKGRGSALLAATDRMWINLKTYAEGGENALHAHTNEDHVFVVLQGEAVFSMPDGGCRRLARNDGILLPRGCTYYFYAGEAEPLVLLRMGCVVDASQSPWRRVGCDGEPLPGSSIKNKSIRTVFSDEYFG